MIGDITMCLVSRYFIWQHCTFCCQFLIAIYTFTIKFNIFIVLLSKCNFITTVNQFECLAHIIQVYKSLIRNAFFISIEDMLDFYIYENYYSFSANNIPLWRIKLLGHYSHGLQIMPNSHVKIVIQPGPYLERNLRVGIGHSISKYAPGSNNYVLRANSTLDTLFALNANSARKVLFALRSNRWLTFLSRFVFILALMSVLQQKNRSLSSYFNFLHKKKTITSALTWRHVNTLLCI